MANLSVELAVSVLTSDKLRQQGEVVLDAVDVCLDTLRDLSLKLDELSEHETVHHHLVQKEGHHLVGHQLQFLLLEELVGDGHCLLVHHHGVFIVELLALTERQGTVLFIQRGRSIDGDL